MNERLERWNLLDAEAAAARILSCCGSQAWAEALAIGRPFGAADHLFAASDAVWWGLPEAAWQEAFNSHPRIGERHVAGRVTAQSLQWSEQEQLAAMSPDAAAHVALEEANHNYEERFGRIFIVCASGKSATEILQLLDVRMSNDPATELHEAAEQQRQITQLRLRRWLEGN